MNANPEDVALAAALADFTLKVRMAAEMNECDIVHPT